MQAAMLSAGRLVVGDIPRPEPAHQEALVRIKTAGVCHSDLHIARQEWLGGRTSGLLGHEAIGIVEALGPGADGFSQVGDRVIVGLGGSGGGYWCGACRHCLEGRTRLCAQSKGIMGTYAEYIGVWAKSLVKLPDTIGDHDVPLACAGLTAYGAVKKLVKFNVLPGSPIAVVGAAGGLGHYAVQIATHFGYKVVGVDVGADKVAFVKSLGAHSAVDVSEARDVVARDFPEGVHASLVFSPRMAGFTLGMDVLARRGVFISIGIPAHSEGNIEIAPFELFRKEPLIMASAVGTVQDMRELVQLAADGNVKTHVSRTGRLSELPTIFDEREAGAYSGRAILTDLAN